MNAISSSVYPAVRSAAWIWESAPGHHPSAHRERTVGRTRSSASANRIAPRWGGISSKSLRSALAASRVNLSAGPITATLRAARTGPYRAHRMSSRTRSIPSSPASATPHHASGCPAGEPPNSEAA